MKVPSKVLRYPARAALGRPGPCPGPCQTPARPLSWIRPSPFASHHHILARAWKTPRLHTHLPDRTTLHHTHRSQAGVPVCSCCALSPARRGRPSAYDRLAPVPHLALTLSSFSRALASLVRLSPFFSRSLARLLHPPSTKVIIIYELSDNLRPRPRPSLDTLVGSDPGVKTDHRSQRNCPRAWKPCKRRGALARDKFAWRRPTAHLPLSSHHPVFPSFARQGDASHLSSASLPIRERCLCSLAVSRPSAPLPAARHARHALDKSLPPPALQQTRHPSPPRSQVSPPPAPPSLSLKPAKPPRRQFPPFLALALVEF